MKVLGIVAEYNPFHNGHKYHIEQSKAATGCDTVVCVMSGNFIQRGEPAFINKFSRTEMALQNGVDLVVELPVPFAMSSAESFGYGAVRILDSMGMVDCISFGSEYGDIEALRFISEILVEEPEEYKEELKKLLDSGLSFPVCRQKALCRYLETSKAPDSASYVSGLLETSNNILGIEYLKALKRLNSPIRPYTVKRISNDYNSTDLTGSVSSATSIRHKINQQSIACPDLEHATAEIAHSIPALSKIIIENEFSEGRGPISICSFENIILGCLRQTEVEKLSQIQGISEGLEYRIKNAANISGNIDELLSNICTKRYARTRIQRILLSLLTGITKGDMNSFMDNGGPQYIRLLGFNSRGKELLSKLKRSCSLPLITKAADYKNSDNRFISRMIEIESLSTDIYVLGYRNPEYRKAGQEFTTNIVITG